MAISKRIAQQRLNELLREMGIKINRDNIAITNDLVYNLSRDLKEFNELMKEYGYYLSVISSESKK